MYIVVKSLNNHSRMLAHADNLSNYKAEELKLSLRPICLIYWVLGLMLCETPEPKKGRLFVYRFRVFSDFLF